jgi:hypothetical protein
MSGEEESQQSSIFSFGENVLKSMKETNTTVIEYGFTEPLRRCSICKILKPMSQFRRRKSGNRSGKYERRCIECEKHRALQYREENPEKAKDTYKRYRENNPEKCKESIKRYRENNSEKIRTREKERGFLCQNNEYTSSGFLNGTGCCLICGENHPLILENHHVYPQNDFVLSLCANCHKKYHAGNNQERHMIAILKAIEQTPFLWKGVIISGNRKQLENELVSYPKIIPTFDGENMEVLTR